MASRGSVSSKIPRLSPSLALPSITRTSPLSSPRSTCNVSTAKAPAHPISSRQNFQISHPTNLEHHADISTITENEDVEVSKILEHSELVVNDLIEATGQKLATFLIGLEEVAEKTLKQEMCNEHCNSEVCCKEPNCTLNLASRVLNPTDEESGSIQFFADTENETDIEEWASICYDLNRSLTSGNKKTKTIFSVDIPLSQVQVTSGPGEHGDGSEVYSAKIKNRNEDLQSVSRHFLGKDVASYSAAESKLLYEKEYEVVTRKNVGGVVENWSYTAIKDPSPSSNAFSIETKAMDERYSQFDGGLKKGAECGAIVSKNLILRRDNTNAVDEFRKLIPIYNSTASLYAFKVCSQDCSTCNFMVSPDIGLLRPGSSICVEIRAKNKSKVKEMIVEDKIEIHIFPASCIYNDAESLDSTYQTFCSQCPSLIHKQNVERVVLWEDANLKTNMEFLNSIENEQESTLLKDELYLFQKTDSCTDKDKSESSTTLFRNIKNQLTIANTHLNEAFQVLASFRKTQAATFYLCGIILLSYIMSGSGQVQQPPPVTEKMSTFEKILNGLYLI